MRLCEVSRAALRLSAVLPLAFAFTVFLAQAANPQPSDQNAQANQTLQPGQSVSANQIGQPDAAASATNASSSISGHVYRNDTGGALGGLIVTLQPGPTDFGVRGASFAMGTITAPDGAFRFTDLDPGSYVVWTQPSGLFRQGPTRPISVAAGQDVTNEDIRLQPTGIISGTVTDQDGEPIEGLTVSVLRPATVPPRPIAQAESFTNDRGGFRVIGIASGEWYVAASTVVYIQGGDSGATYYPGADTEVNATLVKVTAGSETPGIHIVVTIPRSSVPQAATQDGAARGSISGHFTRSDTGAPVPNAVVFLQQHEQVQPGARPHLIPAKLTETSADGGYEFDGLAAGEYGIEGYHPGFLKFPGNSGMQAVTVGTSPVTGIDARLTPAGVISGTLLDANGTPVAQMNVLLTPKGAPVCVPDSCPQARQVTTDDQGNFRLEAAAPGSYYILASVGGMLSPYLGYEPAYYPGTDSMEQAQASNLTGGQEAPPLKFTLRRNPVFSVSVKVVSPGEPDSTYFTINIQKQNAVVVDAAPNSFRFPALVAANATVRLHGFTTGTYRVVINRTNVRLGADRRPVGFGGGGPSVGSATIQVNDSDVSVTVPISSFR